MLRGIDHVVIAVPDLEAAIASYEQLGFTVVRGGRHPIGTHNALIAFRDGAYFELIAFLPGAAPHPWLAALDRGGGLVDFCMQTDDLTRDVDAFRRAGANLSDPAPLTRRRPDGFEVSWVLSLPQPPHSGVLPFLIRDETPRDERVPRQRSHRNSADRIRSLAVAVTDAGAIAKVYAGVLGAAGNPISRPKIDASGFEFKVGPHRIELLAPDGAKGAIAERLKVRGPSPFAVMLSASGAAAGALDPALTLGARISF